VNLSVSTLPVVCACCVLLELWLELEEMGLLQVLCAHLLSLNHMTKINLAQEKGIVGERRSNELIKQERREGVHHNLFQCEMFGDHFEEEPIILPSLLPREEDHCLWEADCLIPP